MSVPSFGFFLQCSSPEELQVVSSAALFAQADHRAGRGGKGEQSITPLPGPMASDVDLIEKALLDYPPNPQKTRLQKLLFDAPNGTWVSFDSIKAGFVDVGLKETQASAALRDMSWQFGQVFPPEALSKLDANVCIFAERMRSGGAFNYRLTEAGRAALRRLQDSE